MVKLYNNQLTEDSLFELKEYNDLFALNLKPLKSKNARKIFKVFIDFADFKYLTTLEIQKYLKKLDSKLTKKEINGWLHALQNAELIKKSDERGKPLTIVYDGKYTFDKWSLTQKGKEISSIIFDFLKRRKFFTFKEINFENFFKSTYDKKKVNQIVDNINEIFVEFNLLRNLLIKEGVMEFNNAMHSLTLQKNDFEIAIKNCLEKGYIRKIERSQENNFMNRFLYFFGLHKHQVELSLTDKGLDFFKSIL